MFVQIINLIIIPRATDANNVPQDQHGMDQDVIALVGRSGCGQQILVHAQTTGHMITLADVTNALRTNMNTQEDVTDAPVANMSTEVVVTDAQVDNTCTLVTVLHALLDQAGVTINVCALMGEIGTLPPTDVIARTEDNGLQILIDVVAQVDNTCTVTDVLHALPDQIGMDQDVIVLVGKSGTLPPTGVIAQVVKLNQTDTVAQQQPHTTIGIHVTNAQKAKSK